MKRVVCDIEGNGLKPTQIWVIVCKDIDTNELKVFRNVTQDRDQREAFLVYAKSITWWSWHNGLGWDYPVLNNLLGLDILDVHLHCVDTLIISKLVNYSRSGHSVEDYGLEFGITKSLFDDYSKWSQELEDRCVTDVEITHRIYLKYQSIIVDPVWQSAIALEQRFQLIVNDLHNNGFAFNKAKAQSLLGRVTEDLSQIDRELADAFPARLKLIKEVVPRVTQHGTLNRNDFRFVKGGDLSEYNGGSFCRCEWVTFNPSSHKQLVEVLVKAGWSPIEKTKTHIDLEREINHIKYKSPFDTSLNDLYSKLDNLKLTGYKINENNLATLPSNAPKPARLLAKRILLEARRRTLTEWISLVSGGRIHGKFYGIGAWTHRMAHQNPNTANITREFKEDGTPKFLGKELRSLWIAPKNRLLVGVDAEGIQLRILAHYLDDPEFTRALVEGKKHDRTDPHSLNQRILGGVCKSRQAAKRFVYALLLGAGISKLAAVLETSKDETEVALQRLMSRYQGWKYLKEHVLPIDGERGWFLGIDGRHVAIPGETSGARKHLAMSGYLQSGEAIVIKKASVLVDEQLKAAKFVRRMIERAQKSPFFVNVVHDEIQLECPNDMTIALEIAKITADAIKEAGEFYKLKCPMAGSYYNEDTHDYTIGCTWFETH